MAEEILLVAKDNGVCTLTLNRPEKRNALNPPLLLRLGDTFTALADDREVRVVIIRGAGGRAFSSGYDMDRLTQDMQSVLREPPGKDPNRAPVDYCMNSIAAYPFPVIAMIYGYCLAGGVALAASCDLRFAAATARFGIPAARIGVVYDYASTRKLVNLVGIARTKEILFSARHLDAQRAEAIGLVDRVLPEAELEPFTYDFAREICQNAPLSLRGTKKVINTLLRCQRPSPADEAEMRELQYRAICSEDVKEGQRAFAEKRQPRFSGR